MQKVSSYDNLRRVQKMLHWRRGETGRIATHGKIGEFNSQKEN